MNNMKPTQTDVPRPAGGDTPDTAEPSDEEIEAERQFFHLGSLLCKLIDRRAASRGAAPPDSNEARQRAALELIATTFCDREVPVAAEAHKDRFCASCIARRALGWDDAIRGAVSERIIEEKYHD